MISDAELLLISKDEWESTETERDLAAELLRRREADRWIPVSERLPEFNENVLVISKKGSQWVAAIDEELGWMDNIEGYIDNDITHWRPLPEPPEEK